MFLWARKNSHKTPLDRALRWLCFLPQKGKLWLILIEPFILIIIGTGVMCSEYGAHHWIKTLDQSKCYNDLVSVHFTAVAALAAFATSVVFLFKEKQWSDSKRDALYKHIEQVLVVDVFFHRKPIVDEDVIEHRDFMDLLKDRAIRLDHKVRRLGTLFSWCLFMIFLNCLLSVLFAYHARLNSSATLYFAAYLFAASAVILICFHVIIVFIPTMVHKSVAKGLEFAEVKKKFKLFQEKNEATKEKSNRPDLGFTLPED